MRLTGHFWRVICGAALLLALAVPASADPFVLSSPMTLTFTGVITSFSNGFSEFFPQIVKGTWFTGSVVIVPELPGRNATRTTIQVGPHAEFRGYEPPWSTVLSNGVVQSWSGGTTGHQHPFIPDELTLRFNPQVIALLTAGILTSATGNNLGSMVMWGTGVTPTFPNGSGGGVQGVITSVSVPEPSTLLLIGAGVLALGASRRRTSQRTIDDERCL